MDKASRAAEERGARIEKAIKRTAHVIETTLAAVGIEKFVEKVVEATIENEDAIRQLEARLASTGNTAGRTSKQIQDFAKALQDTTTYSHAAVVGAETVLLAFQNIKGDTLDKATVATLNLATALKKDLPEAAKLIGLALNDPVKGVQRLQRAGVALTQDQVKLIKALASTGDIAGAQRVIFEALARAYGGAAAAATETLGGALTQMKNAFHDLFEATDTAETQKQIHALTAVLTDPKTIEAANTLSNAIILAMGKAAEAIVYVIDLFKRLPDNEGEAKAKLRGIVDAAQAEVDRLAKKVEDGPNLLDKLFLYDEEFFKRSLAKAKKDLVAAQKELQDYLDSHQGFQELPPPPAPNPALAGGKAVPGGATNPYDDSEELKSLEAQIKAQKDYAAHIKHINELFQQQMLVLQEKGAVEKTATELEKTRYDVTSGALKDILPAQKEMLLILAAQATATEQATEAEKKHQENIKHGQEVTKELGTPYDAYIERVRELKVLLDDSAITLETYRSGVVKAAREMKDASAKTSEWSVFVEQAHRNLQDILSNTLSNAFDGQKTNILKSFADMLKQMAAQAISAKILDALFNTATNSQSGIAQFFRNVFGGFFGGSKAAANVGKAGGGPVSAGTAYRVGEQGPEWILPMADGYVVPHGEAAAAGGGGLNVQIINPPAHPQVQESRSANGTRQLQVVFDRMFQSSLADGRFDSPMRSRFGVRPTTGGGR